MIFEQYSIEQLNLKILEKLIQNKILDSSISKFDNNKTKIISLDDFKFLCGKYCINDIRPYIDYFHNQITSDYFDILFDSYISNLDLFWNYFSTEQYHNKLTSKHIDIVIQIIKANSPVNEIYNDNLKKLYQFIPQFPFNEEQKKDIFYQIYNRSNSFNNSNNSKSILYDNIKLGYIHSTKTSYNYLKELLQFWILNKNGSQNTKILCHSVIRCLKIKSKYKYIYLKENIGGCNEEVLILCQYYLNPNKKYIYIESLILNPKLLIKNRPQKYEYMAKKILNLLEKEYINTKYKKIKLSAINLKVANYYRNICGFEFTNNIIEIDLKMEKTIKNE